eukprot:scaffold655399_cov45-Prasinocladus_malaysianus.AAC.1
MLLAVTIFILQQNIACKLTGRSCAGSSACVLPAIGMSVCVSCKRNDPAKFLKRRDRRWLSAHASTA